MIVLDYRDRRPLYEQVTEKLEELMFSGVLPSDSRLPSVRSMATELSINPNTIQRAYAELERQGYIYSIQEKEVLFQMEDILQRGYARTGKSSLTQP